MLINNDFISLDEKLDLKKAFTVFNKQRTQNFVDSENPSKKTLKFKFYVSKKVENFKKLPPKNFKKNLIKIFVGVVIFSVFVSSVVSFKFGVAHEKISQQNNVCVEYEVCYGDTNTSLNEMFYEYGYSHFTLSGVDQNSSPNNGNPFAGDKVVGSKLYAIWRV